MIGTQPAKVALRSHFFFPRLDERLWVEICMHTVMQKCVKFDVVYMTVARWHCEALPYTNTKSVRMH